MTVLMSGCFDPLHSGHVRFIQAVTRHWPTATILCAVEPDEELARRKGRPACLPDTMRADVLRAFGLTVTVSTATELLAEYGAGIDIYASTMEWKHRLPAELLALCHEHDVLVSLLDTPRLASSTQLLDAYCTKRQAVERVH